MHTVGDDGDKMSFEKALTELRKEKKRNFEQSVDLIINLKGIDVKRDNVNAVISLPHKIKDKRVCGFFTKKTSAVKTVTDLDFPKYKDKKELKNLIKDFDFFIAEAKLMPSVATTFGKVLGPTGKMPSPQLGILPVVDDASIKNVLEKINKSVKIKAKEASIKIQIGKEKMDDQQIIENASAVYNGIVNALPIKKDNVRKVMLKLSMSKPIVVEGI